MVGVLPCLVGILKLVDTGCFDTDTCNTAGKHALELAGKLNGQLSANQVHALRDFLDYICPSIVGELDLVLMPYEEPELHTWAPEETEGHRQSISFVRFVCMIRNSKEVQRAIADDHEKLIDLVINIEKLTDPEDPDYQRALRDTDETQRKAKADTRRDKIKFEAFIKRLVHYMESVSEDSSPATFVQVLYVLSSHITRAIKSYMNVDVEVLGDKALQIAREAMINMQEVIAQSGAAVLCVRKLIYSKRDAVASGAMDHIICMIEGGNLRVQQVV